MVDKPGIRLEQRPGLEQKMTQRLMMMPQMQQAIRILQMPILEISQMIDLEIQQNPLLESEEDAEYEQYEDDQNPLDENEQNSEEELKLSDDDFEILRHLDEEMRDHFDQSENFAIQNSSREMMKQNFLDSLIQNDKSLFELLLEQAHEYFETDEEIETAKILIGNFDNNGFLTTTIDELVKMNGIDKEKFQKALEGIQTFEPHGVGATTLQESLLIQLTHQGKRETLSYEIIAKHYDDLLHNRIPLIAKKLNKTPHLVQEEIDTTITHLDLHPGAAPSRMENQQITPDIIYKLNDDVLECELYDEPIPQIRINSKYIRMFQNPNLENDVKAFIQQKLAATKWLLRALDQRNGTLYRIAETLKVRQEPFLKEPGGQLKPLTMKEIASELELHESTIARAVANKYAQTPKGVFALRSFFTNSLEKNETDEIATPTVRSMIEEMVSREDKRKPFSDQKISNNLAKRGIKCARRTVAKYRQELRLGNAQQRRVY